MLTMEPKAAGPDLLFDEADYLFDDLSIGGSREESRRCCERQNAVWLLHLRRGSYVRVRLRLRLLNEQCSMQVSTRLKRLKADP